MINRVNTDIKNAALSPDKKINIKANKNMTRLKAVNLKSFLKNRIRAINNGSNLDKKLPRIRSSLKNPEILSILYFSYPNKFFSNIN